MRSYVRTGLALAGTALVVVVLAACGSSSSSSGGGGGSSTTSTSSIPLKPGENPVGQTLYGKKKGGVLTLVRQLFQGLLFPLCNLGRMYPVF